MLLSRLFVICTLPTLNQGHGGSRPQPHGTVDDVLGAWTRAPAEHFNEGALHDQDIGAAMAR